MQHYASLVAPREGVINSDQVIWDPHLLYIIVQWFTFWDSHIKAIWRNMWFIQGWRSSKSLKKKKTKNKPANQTKKTQTKTWRQAFPQRFIVKGTPICPRWVTWSPSIVYLTSTVKIGLSKWDGFITVLCSNRRFGINIIFFPTNMLNLVLVPWGNLPLKNILLQFK